MDYWRYNQLSGFVKSLAKLLITHSDLSPVKNLLADTQLSQKTNSQFYRALLALGPLTWPKCTAKWEEDFQQPLSDAKCSTVLQMAHTSISSRLAETNSKFLTWWHYMPAFLHKAFPDITELFWRGCGAVVMHAHICWQCPLILSFWASMLQRTFMVSLSLMIPGLCCFIAQANQQADTKILSHHIYWMLRKRSYQNTGKNLLSPRTNHGFM